MNTVYQGGVDEGREGMDADKIRATKDYGHLYSHFDYLTTGKWLQQTCRQPVSDASGAFVARAVELLLRHTIDNVLEIARVRQNPPKTADFDGTDLEVIESGPNMLERLSSMAKSSAAQARESSSMLDVSSLQGKDNEKWGASNLGEQNKAVSSSIAMLNRKRKQGTAAAEEAKRKRLEAAGAAAGAPELGAASEATGRQAVAGVPAGRAGLGDVLQYCRRNPQLHKSPQLNHLYSKLK